MDVKRDLLILFCSLLFYFAFLILNVTHSEGSKENPNFTIGDEPPERCMPRYEDRIFRDDSGHIRLRCVKIGVPDIEIYEKSCEELNLTNSEDYPERCDIP